MKFAYLFLFLAKKLSHNFDRMILRKNSGGGSLVALRFFG